jgi:hypothetical protein
LPWNIYWLAGLAPAFLANGLPSGLTSHPGGGVRYDSIFHAAIVSGRARRIQRRRRLPRKREPRRRLRARSRRPNVCHKLRLALLLATAGALPSSGAAGLLAE